MSNRHLNAEMKMKTKIGIGMLAVLVIVAIAVGNAGFLKGAFGSIPFRSFKKISTLPPKYAKTILPVNESARCAAMKAMGKPCPVQRQPEQIQYGNCVPVINNGSPKTNYNFVIAFHDFDPQEFSTKAFDYTRAQFYRSEYDVPNKNDPNFGFSQYPVGKFGPNFYTSRAGLFEVLPFKTYVNKFSVFYVNHQFDTATNPYNAIPSECPFLAGTQNKIIVFKHENTPWPNYNVWVLERMGESFLHEIGHQFGLTDEYYTMGRNNLSQTEIAEWTSHSSPNCDYNHPSTSAGYQTGNGYCTKWCLGVNPTAYQSYKVQRDRYDSCESQLLHPTSLESWMDYCKNTLDFSRMQTEPYVGMERFPYVYGETGWISPSSLDESCQNIYTRNVTSNVIFHQDNIVRFCFGGTLYNIFDLDIGQSCETGTGCFAGCGGVAGYPQYRAFEDAMKPQALSIMGGGPVTNGGQDPINAAHKNDNESPNYGAYDIKQITNKFRAMGLIP